ncbi:MAG TPA: rod-binding protein [Planctomycetota bacterium]|nr:rod-binding protein [Planctomycetota bacterium]
MQIGGDIQIAQTASSAQTDQLAKTAASLAAKSKDAKSQAEVPHQFSKLMATMLVKEMRQALPEGFFGEGTGADIFNGWLDEHIGAALAERDGLRLEDMIAHSMQTKIDATAEPAPAKLERP